MFCEMCGKKIEDGNAFCPFCGYRSEPVHTMVGEEAPVPTDEAVSWIQNNDVFSDDENTLTSADFSVNRYSAGNAAYGMPTQETPYMQQQVNNKIHNEKPAAKKKNGGKITIIIVLVAVLLIGVAFGAFWFITDGKLFSSDKNTDAGADETTTAVVTVPEGVFSPDTTVSDKNYYVNISTLTIYKGPDAASYKAVCNVSKDDVLVVKGSHSGYSEWLYVYSAKTNDYGWVSAAFISEPESENTTTDANTATEIVYYDVASRFDVMVNVGEGHGLNLRRKPDTTDPDNIILLLPDKAKVLVLGVSGENSKWYYVEYTDEYGTYYGYIHSDHTQRFY